MFFRFIGRIVFYFVIIPNIVDFIRSVHKHAAPDLYQMLADRMKEMSRDAEIDNERRASCMSV